MKKRSEMLFDKAVQYIPGGVNSPVRAFKAVDLTPIFISRASGSRIWDVDGNEYIDYMASWGPMILGHSHPAVVEAVREASAQGTSYGLPTDKEVEMAELITEAFPSIDMVRMVSSGTEATMSAIRLARGSTGRDRIVKFDGCYHGHSDSLLVKAGSGVATLGIPGSPGVPRKLAELTITLPYNDSEAVTAALDACGDDIACVIVEPVAGNMGVVPPQPGFLELLREKTGEKGIVLIFDEVITGFRVTYGGYQNVTGIEPDLTCLGKIIGGGLPVGAFGGRRDIMENLAPAGSVYQAGTLSGNPLALAAGLASLRILKDRECYETLEKKASRLCEEIKTMCKRKGISHRLNRVGSMFTLFFTGGEVLDFTSAAASDTQLFARYFRNMLAAGVCTAPSQFEAAFVSLAHDDRDIEITIDRMEKALGALAVR